MTTLDLDAVKAHLTYAADPSRLDGDRAASRYWLAETMPLLVEEVERLRAELAEAKRYHDQLIEDLTALIPEEYDDDAAAEAIVLCWARDQSAVDPRALLRSVEAIRGHVEAVAETLGVKPTTVDEHAEQAFRMATRQLTDEEFADLERKFSAAGDGVRRPERGGQ